MIENLIVIVIDLLPRLPPSNCKTHTLVSVILVFVLIVAVDELGADGSSSVAEGTR